MREVVEYAVGIFHGSIMAIQSGGGEGGVGVRAEFVVSTWERRDLSGGEPRRAARRPLECALHLSPARSRRCFLSVSGQPKGA